MLFLQANIEQGWVVTIVGMMLVFTALLSLFLAFQFVLPAVLRLMDKKATTRKSDVEGEIVEDGEISGETAAAIAMALYQYTQEAHDEENAVLTIAKSPKSYSPWSSKIYTTHSKYLRK